MNNKNKMIPSERSHISENVHDYKDTLILPKTRFPMRGNLSHSELGLIEYWENIHLYDQVRDQSLKRENFFLLHDGPPYANGPVHIGSAFNKILKDMVNKARFMAGYGVNYVPGWDCHGLPIEWRVEQDFIKKKVFKDMLDPLTFRRACRDFAKDNVAKQKKSFQRLGIIGRFNDPYITMDYAVESKIAQQIWHLTKKKYIYHGVLPVYWSIAEKTVLAEAEIEYQNKTSPSLWVAFDVEWDLPYKAAFVVWTTTPWTLPGNRALAISQTLNYVVYDVQKVMDTSEVLVGTKLIFAKDSIDQVVKALGISEGKVHATLTGNQLLIYKARHTFKTEGYKFTVPLIHASFVDPTVGSGVVHVAPAHGHDDFQLGKQHHLEVKQLLTDDGLFLDTVPVFAGLPIYDKNWKVGQGHQAILDHLRSVQSLLNIGTLNHSYPHSWRSHRPLIIRTLKQWFISLDNQQQLRKHALKDMESIRFIPKSGRNRLSSMITNRGDWCISRQRIWGVPIPLFVHKESGDILLDTKVEQNILSIFAKQSSDSWFSLPASTFLGNDYKPEDYEQVFDVVDVWFESGCTHDFVLDHPKEGLTRPADLYLEGSDQHRGWFQSSLLEGIASSGHVPMKAILTHGFVLDKNGHKMSKSIGNVTAPEDIAKHHGAEMIRLWAATSEYTDDVRIGNDAIQGCSDMYRRIRNVLKWLLGMLHDDAPVERVSYDHLYPLEKWLMNRLYHVNAQVIQAYDDFDFSKAWRIIFDFCNQDLSSFYFDVRKDSLYCDPLFYERRQSSMTALDIVFDTIIPLLAPILSFTAEESYRIRYPKNDSIHLGAFNILDARFKNPNIQHDFDNILKVRKVVLHALESVRKQGDIGSSLEASPTLFLSDSLLQVMQKYPLEDYCITSSLVLKSLKNQNITSDMYSLPEIPEVYVVIHKALGQKSARSWKYSLDVGENKDYPDLSKRDIQALQALSIS